MERQWYETSYRRSLVDMHIPDWDERFLAEFESEEYIRLMALAKVDTVYIYATSCVGLANYPAKADNGHKGLAGKDIVGEITTLAKSRSMNVVVYYNIWSKWAYDHHPEWRVVSAKGKGTADYMWDQPGRYGVCCINSPYRLFALEQIAELCENYTFDGFWIDMILLPQTICYCADCRKRYYEETGISELPTVIDWDDAGFVAFQRRRESWLNEFTGLIAETVSRIKPTASIGYNVSSYSVGWQSGGNKDFFNYNSYLSGDVSSDPLTVSYTCKLFHSSNPKHAMEFMTSLADSNLLEHTIMKTKDHLRAQLFLTIAHQSSFGFIDAIDPAGTLNEKTYLMMGELYDELIPLEPYLDASAAFCQDVAIYTNFESLIDIGDNRKETREVEVGMSPHFIASMNAAKSLINANIPFGVINNLSLSKLDQYQVVILPDLLVIGAEEVQALKQYVERGGGLYASFNSSLLDNEGKRHPDFLLSEVLGVSYVGRTQENVTYVAPKGRGEGLLPDYSVKYPLSMTSDQLLITAHASAEILATLALPDLDPRNVHRFSSAISSPPEIETDYPSVVSHSYGLGKTIYAAGPLERMEKEQQRRFFIRIIESLITKPKKFMTNAPKAVELTLFHQANNRRFVMHAVNIQKELPNIPVRNIEVKILLEFAQPEALQIIPSGLALDYRFDGRYVAFELPLLVTHVMIVLDYGA
ncbi:beta-galactosidase trimerization domain-containing protein [Cohnella sp. GCM10012308]|uniref:beta-galactosidase trimerization domain-containing protein n=1 Tax=Cohnella sp. GCM10012308 TaxID=3317329 RepID=UPI00361F1080